MRSPVAISNGWAPVLASYSAITLFTSSMSAVAGSYSRSVVSPWDENVTILAFMLGLLRDVHLRSSVEQQSAGFGVPSAHIAPFLGVVKTPRMSLKMGASLHLPIARAGRIKTSSFWATCASLIGRDSASTYGRMNRRVFGQA